MKHTPALVDFEEIPNEAVIAARCRLNGTLVGSADHCLTASTFMLKFPTSRFENCPIRLPELTVPKCEATSWSRGKCRLGDSKVSQRWSTAGCLRSKFGRTANSKPTPRIFSKRRWKKWGFQRGLTTRFCESAARSPILKTPIRFQRLTSAKRSTTERSTGTTGSKSVALTVADLDRCPAVQRVSDRELIVTGFR